MKMADFKKRSFGNRDSGRSSRGGSGRSRDGESRGESRGFGRDNRSGGSSEYKQSFRVTCDKCAKSCEVPFKPTGNKPVYCSDCFRKNEKKSTKYDDFNEFDRIEKTKSPSNQSNDLLLKRLDAIEEKIDKILESLSLD